MIALLVIDMQVGLFEGIPPRYDADGVIQRINEVSHAVRNNGGIVVFIQHEDRGLKPGTKGWRILPALFRTDADLLIRKKACDSFYESKLGELLEQHDVRQLIVTGCATDFCVDTTIRSAANKDYEVLVVADGHTTKNRPHLDAPVIITHHNWMWENLIHPTIVVKVLPAKEVIKWLDSGSRS